MRSIPKSIILTIREILLRVISPFLSQGMCSFSDDKIERILIIRIDGIGDMVLSIPAIKALRHRFPSAHITVLASEANKSLLQGAAYIDDVIAYRKGLDLKALSFDIVFDLLDNYPLKTALIAYATKAKYRVGFDINGRGVFFNLKAPQPKTHRHYVDAMLDLAALVGAKIDSRSPALDISALEQDEAVQFLRKNNVHKEDIIACVHPGAKNWTGQWLPERFSRLADKMIQEKLAKVIFVGAEYDQALIDQIKGAMNGEVLCYAGYPLRSVAALIQQANVLICNNSGLLHMACALKTPTVSTMGPTLSKKWWPVGSRNIVLRQDIPCIGCGKGYCKIGTHDCMHGITVEDALEAVKNQLQNPVQ